MATLIQSYEDEPCGCVIAVYTIAERCTTAPDIVVRRRVAVGADCSHGHRLRITSSRELEPATA